MKISLEMLRIFALCGFLTSALSLLNVDVTFGGVDEASYENSLREQKFSDDDIELFLQVRWSLAEGSREENIKYHCI